MKEKINRVINSVSDVRNGVSSCVQIKETCNHEAKTVEVNDVKAEGKKNQRSH